MFATLWNDVFIRPLTNLLIGITDVIPGHDLGVAIIILTIIIRFILYPLSKKAIQSQRELQAYQPELDKIKEKYKNDKDKQTKATMEFYQEHKINPLSSCLPLLIQMPILIALYWVFRRATAGTVEQLLYSFVPKPENLNARFLGIVDLTRPEVYVLPVLAGASQFYQSWMILSRAKKDDKKLGLKEKKTPQDATSMITKQMNYIFPIVTVVFAASLPSAISLYWVTTNLFSIGQQYIIMRGELTKPKVTVRRK
jgi:YidC/Oxa1 family membrane protein insertase